MHAGLAARLKVTPPSDCLIIVAGFVLFRLDVRLCKTRRIRFPCYARQSEEVFPLRWKKSENTRLVRPTLSLPLYCPSFQSGARDQEGVT
jgi:hypothetical protein